MSVSLFLALLPSQLSQMTLFQTPKQKKVKRNQTRALSATRATSELCISWSDLFSSKDQMCPLAAGGV